VEKIRSKKIQALKNSGPEKFRPEKQRQKN
jgi:hypothetical protein